jgi:hypothetical protein
MVVRYICLTWPILINQSATYPIIQFISSFIQRSIENTNKYINQNITYIIHIISFYSIDQIKQFLFKPFGVLSVAHIVSAKVTNTKEDTDNKGSQQVLPQPVV